METARFIWFMLLLLGVFTNSITTTELFLGIIIAELWKINYGSD